MTSRWPLLMESEHMARWPYQLTKPNLAIFFAIPHVESVSEKLRPIVAVAGDTLCSVVDRPRLTC